MNRYLVIGAGGSGKSTLSRFIADQLEIPYFDTDSMYWRQVGSLVRMKM